MFKIFATVALALIMFKLNLWGDLFLIVIAGISIWAVITFASAYTKPTKRNPIVRDR